MKLRVLNKSLSLEDEAPKISNLDLSNPKVEMRSDSSSVSSESDLETTEIMDVEPIISPCLLVRHIKCECLLQDEKNVPLIMCSVCKNWQHAICYNLLIEEADASKKSKKYQVDQQVLEQNINSNSTFERVQPKQASAKTTAGSQEVGINNNNKVAKGSPKRSPNRAFNDIQNLPSAQSSRRSANRSESNRKRRRSSESENTYRSRND